MPQDWLAKEPKLAEGCNGWRNLRMCVCVCVRVCLCFCRPYRCICMPYQIWLLREICASALVNRLYKLNIMRCATFTYHLFSGLGLGRDPGPGTNSAVWMHHTSTVLEGTYMAIIHFVLLIASFCEVTKEEHNTWSRCWMLHSSQASLLQGKGLTSVSAICFCQHDDGHILWPATHLHTIETYVLCVCLNCCTT